MSLWAVLASPLLVSMDVRTMTSDCVALITNQRALDVHQDSAGVSLFAFVTVVSCVQRYSVCLPWNSVYPFLGLVV